MKILVTGAAGFVGKNLTVSLKNIQAGMNMIFIRIRLCWMNTVKKQTLYFIWRE